jgi:hypothetical protein
MAGLAVDRIQNYYQYQDAEAKFHSVSSFIEINRDILFEREESMSG